MYTVTSGFLDTLASGNMRVAVKVTTLDGTELAVSDGAVTMDARRNTTRTCELNLVPTATLSADDIFDLVMEPDTEIAVYRGLYVNGIAEYVQLGVFSTDTATLPRDVQGQVRFSGSDRSKKISRSKFVDPYQITAGTSLATAMTDLLQSRWAYCQVDFSNVSESVTANLVFEAGESSDPWQEARAIMSDYGYDLHFNGDGIAVAQVVPDPATSDVAFNFGSGDTNLVLGGDLNGSTENVYNGVIAVGEGSGVATPVRGIAWDTDPNSPTYYLSGFGLSPFFFSSPLLTTQALADSAAASLLALMKGKLQKLSWPAVVNPALEPLDVVSLTYGDTLSVVVLDSLTIPLKASDSMSANARQVQL
jgi:hypothetical protein